MHKLLAKQLAKATDPAGHVDMATLCESVSAAYVAIDQDRWRLERSISLMVEELDQLSGRGREQLLAQLQEQNIRFAMAIEKHDAGPVHVRCRPAPHRLQQALLGDVQAVP